MVEYKENEQVWLIGRMCAALAHLLTNKVQERWLKIVAKVPQYERLT